MKKLLAIIIFSITFAYVEASVVYHLRQIFNWSAEQNTTTSQSLLNLGAIAFISTPKDLFNRANIIVVEKWREIATIIMLLSLAYIAGKKFSQKLGAFLIAFGVWDIFYYVFLRILTGWPKSLSDIDIYFLVPTVWLGPVITPVVVSTLFFITGVILYYR